MNLIKNIWNADTRMAIYIWLCFVSLILLGNILDGPPTQDKLIKVSGHVSVINQREPHIIFQSNVNELIPFDFPNGFTFGKKNTNGLGFNAERDLKKCVGDVFYTNKILTLGSEKLAWQIKCHNPPNFHLYLDENYYERKLGIQIFLVFILTIFYLICIFAIQYRKNKENE